jgi:hypothetical protein
MNRLKVLLLSVVFPLIGGSAVALNWEMYTNTYGARYVNAGVATYGGNWNLKTGITYDAKDNKAGGNAEVGLSQGFELAGMDARFNLGAGVMAVGDTKWTASAGISLSRYGVMSFNIGLTTVDGKNLYPYIGLTVGK